MSTSPIDYAALAKQAGAVNSTPSSGSVPVDYTALAKQAGAVSSTPPVEPTMAEKHPYVAKALSFIPAATATGAGLLASGSGPAAIGAAAAGGVAGKALENSLEEGFGFKPKETSAGSELTSLGVEGVKQGAYELGGRAVGALGGKAINALRGVKPEAVGDIVGGVKLPTTAGQASGNRLSQTLEHYLYGSWLGKPLQAVKAGQQDASRQILANLSKATDANPANLAGNWEKATQETRILGDSLYEPLKETEASGVGPVATDILKDSTVPLSGKARTLLSKVATDPEAITAQRMGYKTADEARSKLGNSTFNTLLQKEQAVGALPAGGNIGDALAARSELRNLTEQTSDRNLARIYHDAWQRLDAGIDAALSPEQRAMKAEADAVWRRSYIQEGIKDELQKMQFAQAPGQEAPVAVDSFVRMVNDLAHQPLTRRAGEVVASPSKLDLLFDNPADRKAMTGLADFMKTKYTTMGGSQGISESIARIGLALEALTIPSAVALGHPAVAAHGAATLSGLWALSHVLANPGGARLMAQYFRAPAAEAGALAGRIAGEAMGQGGVAKALKPTGQAQAPQGAQR